jgi:hypothetical protein
MHTKKKTLKNRNDITWTPVLRGETYCSPACGSGCTKSNYDHAVKKGGELKKRLMGRNWKIHIVENMCWFFYATSGPLQVYETDGKFYCMCSDEPNGQNGSLVWTSSCITHTFKDPNAAVKDTLNAVHKAIDKLIHVENLAKRAAGL